MRRERDLNKGDAPTLILAVLFRGPSHGYAIARAIEQQSGQVLQIGEGALYPALRALESEGWVVASWDTQNPGPARKVYALTETGRSELERRTQEWKRFSQAMDGVIEGEQNAKTI